MVRDTSILAYTDIKPELGDRQQKVYDAIKKLGCPTNLEISKYLKIPINSITPRTNELVEQGLVVLCEKRPCTFTGRTCCSWRVV